MKLSLAARIIGLTCAVLIVLFFFLSIDRYETSYKEHKNNLSRTKLASLDVNNAMLLIRGNLKVDYDQVVIKIGLLEALLTELHALESQDLSRNHQWEIVSQKPILLPIDKLTGLVQRRIDVIEQFKSTFSILRNSQLITFQLLDELREEGLPTEEFNKDLNTIERHMLHVMQFSGSHYRSVLKTELTAFKAKFGQSDSQFINELIQFIVNHANTIFQSESTILTLVESEILLATQINQEISTLESALKTRGDTESLRALKFFYALVTVSVFMLFFSMFEARKSYQLTRQLSEHNANLEVVVEKRTEYLEAAKQKLQIEKQERDILLIELEHSKAKLNALINNVRGCVYEYCLEDKKVHYINRGVEDIWGITKDTVSSIDMLWKGIAAEDTEEHRIKTNTAIEEDVSFSIEYRVVKPDNEVVWVREIGTPIIGDDGFHYVVGVVVDITEFKQAEEEKRKMESELAHARKLESVQHLAAGVAHEINTPAQFISDNLIFLQESLDDILGAVAYVNTLITTLGSEELKQGVESEFEKAEWDYLKDEVPMAMVQSIEGIAHIATIVSAMKVYTHSDVPSCLVDVNAALESTVTELNTQWEHLANIKMNFDNTLPNVKCVMGDINQAVSNIFTNAAQTIEEKYGEVSNQKGEVAVSTEYENNHIYIRISDNGTGITDDVKGRIFDQFFTTKDVGKGTGLGLSVTHYVITEKHQGKIDVESTVGEGTTFIIALPIEYLSDK